ncbi:MAG: SUMF1/EgtB/PvdO family nonheme iron enzyme, partial [Nanoarchaeota archaeon]
IDYVILDVSVNEIRESSLEDYTNAVIELANMAKEKNPNLKVIVLAPTPFKGPNYWSQAQQDKQDAFNENLLNGALSKSGFIDYPVDTYSALEDPPGSDSCGKYCKGDNLHFYDGTGRKQVIKTMLDTVFGAVTTATVVVNAPVSSSATVSTPSSGLTVENCLSKQRCDEIDEVWLRIVSWINTARKTFLWDTVKQEWRSKSSPAITVTPAPTVPSVSATGIAPLAMVGGDAYLRAFMRMITKYEGTAKSCGGISPYQTLVGGVVKSDPQGRYGGKLSSNCYGNYFNGFNGHPAISVEWHEGSPTSSAAGRYQFLTGSWQSKYAPLSSKGVEDFSPQNQDEVVHNWLKNEGIDQLLKSAGTNPDTSSEAFKDTWQMIMETKKIGKEWASLPYACYSNQGCHKRDSSRFKESAEIYAQLLKEELGGSSSQTLSPSPVTSGATVISFKNSILEQACTPESLICVIPQQNVGKQEVQLSSQCPPGMIKTGSLCIDQYEAMLVDKNTGVVWSPYCSPGNEISRLRAVSIAGAIPQSTVSQLEAKQACANAGKRLCTAQEWQSTCQGADGNKYPYGASQQKGACNDELIYTLAHATERTVTTYCPTWKQYSKTGIYTDTPWMISPITNQLPGTLAAAGSFQECKTPEIVYDLVGNLDEWVDGTKTCTSGGATYTCGSFLGGFYARSEKKDGAGGCTYSTTAHGPSYSDYSLGFRCCATLS